MRKVTPAGLSIVHASTMSSSFMKTAERNATRSLRKARRDLVYGTYISISSTFLSPPTVADLEERLLPCPQYVYCQDRELSGIRFCNIVIVIVGVVNVVVVVYVELQEFAVVFLQIPVELWILLGELGQFQHVRGALIYVVQVLSKKKVDRKFLPRRAPSSSSTDANDAPSSSSSSMSTSASSSSFSVSRPSSGSST